MVLPRSEEQEGVEADGQSGSRDRPREGRALLRGSDRARASAGRPEGRPQSAWIRSARPAILSDDRRGKERNGSPTGRSEGAPSGRDDATGGELRRPGEPAPMDRLRQLARTPVRIASPVAAGSSPARRRSERSASPSAPLDRVATSERRAGGSSGVPNWPSPIPWIGRSSGELVENGSIDRPFQPADSHGTEVAFRMPRGGPGGKSHSNELLPSQRDPTARSPT